MVAPVILIEAQPRRADGVVETVRLGGGGGALPYIYAGQHYRAGIEALPTVIGSLTYDGEIVGGGVTEAMTLSWAPAGHAGVNDLSRFFWPDTAIIVRFGPEGALPPVLSQGKVTDAASAEGKLSIAMADPAADVMKPLPAIYYAGTGDLEGPADWEKKIKRRVWGRIFNLEAEPIDKANNVYCLSDPTRPIQAITEVRESGAPVTTITLGWQGSAAATVAALRASAVPDGQAIICPSISCIKFWNQPAALHADLRGEVGAAYVETAAEIAERLVQALGGPAFAVGAVAAAKVLRPAPIGWLVDEETTTVAAMLDDMLAEVSLMWLLEPTGDIVLRPWAWGASVAAAVSQDVARKKSFAPVTTRKIGYRQNESVMARGDLAAIVLATDLSYLDGTPMEDLKPAEGGATYGAPGPAPVGSITGDDVASTINAGGGVAADQVNTIAIGDDAVTDVQQAYNGSAIVGDGSYKTLVSYSFVLAQPGDIIVWADVSQTFTSGAKNWGYRISVAGVAVNSVTGNVVHPTVAMSGRLSVPAGTHVVLFEGMGADATLQINPSSASLIALRRYK